MMDFKPKTVDLISSLCSGFHPNETYSQTYNQAVEEVSPVEFVGGAGDVLFLVRCWAHHPRYLDLPLRDCLGLQHPLMLHSAGIHSAQHGAGTLRIATVMEWQRARPASEEDRTLWWTLNVSENDEFCILIELTTRNCAFQNENCAFKMMSFAGLDAC